MRDPLERPVCHRAEDLVTYLYGEASQSERLDFQDHLQRCDACRSEFAVFNQVHDSILIWRNEALGASYAPAALANENASDETQFVRRERKVSAWAAIREFFQVSPLWLRGATAFAGLLLCVLVVLTISRAWQRPSVVTVEKEPKIYTNSDFQNAVAKEVQARTDEMQRASAPQPKELTAPDKTNPRNELARIRNSTKPRVKALSPEESEQLAADLRLIPGEDDEQLFGSADQPNQPE